MKILLLCLTIFSSFIVGCGNNNDSLADSILVEYERLHEKGAILDSKNLLTDPSAMKDVEALQKQFVIFNKKCEGMRGTLNPEQFAKFEAKFKAIEAKYGHP